MTVERRGAPVSGTDAAAFERDIALHTDQYFRRTRAIVAHFGDCEATYAIFMRRPVVSAPRLAIAWLEEAARMRATSFAIEICKREGQWVGAGEPILYVTGKLSLLADLETRVLQLLGPACVAAHNAAAMCTDLPRTAFLAMDARHDGGAEMAEMMAYAASVGSRRAQRKAGAVGFIGSSTDAAAPWFGAAAGQGTMPHALIGYAGSTLRAAEMYRALYPDEPLTVLVDYFGREIADSLEVAERFPDLAAAGRLAIRLDTPGGRFIEGLDQARAYQVLERHAPQAIRGYRTESELRHLIGPGVSAAAIWHLRECLDGANHPRVRIVASSGFGPEKCKMMAAAEAPIDVVGTGSFLPENWPETYATADIVAYDGEPRVKLGREFLLKKTRR